MLRILRQIFIHSTKVHRMNHAFSGNIIDPVNRRIFKGILQIENGRIASITETEDVSDQYILPGFVDAHIHIESSMLPPSLFSAAAVVHGTVATVSDPHEIANVLGVEGVNYMLNEAAKVPLKICFGAPSCVPATAFETAGAKLTAEDVHQLLARPEIGYLSEVMNFPGVIHQDPELMKMIASAQQFGKPVDGHAPGVTGDALKAYISAGIQTDHECFTLAEAQEKLALGVKILIREGSAAKNFDALHPIIGTHHKEVMFCCDDKHPDELMHGHINLIVKRALALGYDLMDVLNAASVNPVKHYGLKVGLLQVGDPADFIVVNNLEAFEVQQTVLDGVLVSEHGKSLLPLPTPALINHFVKRTVQESDFEVLGSSTVKSIVALDRQLITREEMVELPVVGTARQIDVSQDVLKIAVVNRYREAPVFTAFIKGFGLKKGAIGSTVAHDSHNLVVVGSNEADMATVANSILEMGGGIGFASGGEVHTMALPIAGLMTDLPVDRASEAYAELDKMAKESGSTLTAPFMTLSFMALPVIPDLKVTDLGLFDVNKFSFTEC